MNVTKGTTVRLFGTFAIADGTLTNPTVPTVGIVDPASVTTTFTPTNDSAGQYHYDLACTSVGNYTINFKGTGAVAVVGADQTITVEASTVFP